MRTATLLATILAFAACKKKDPAPAAAETEPAAPKVSWSVEMPSDPAAKKLAENLVEHGLSDLSPTGSSQFTLDFDFEPSGAWTAKGHADLGGETFDCQESGTWKIDEMTDARGTVQWTIEKTNCPNRSVDTTERALIGFEGDQPSVSFR